MEPWEAAAWCAFYYRQLSGRFRYTGQAWIPELGMYYYKARIYSPTLGRFLQTDPIGYEDQFNLYAYVANDPVNKVDPTGEILRAIVSGGKVLGKAIFKGKRVDKAAVDEFVGAVDDVTTIISDPLSVDAAAAAVDLVVGTELNNKGSRGARVGSKIDPNGSTRASDIEADASSVGFTRTQTEGGPVKFTDENGVARVTVKSGSSRASGSANPHVELKDSSGQRVNPAGNPVTRKSPENHTPIIDDRK